MPQALKIYANSLIFKTYLKLLLIAGINLILLSFVIRGIFPIHYLMPPLFFSDLITFPLRIPIWIIYLLDPLSLYLVWVIGRKVVNTKFGFFCALILGISPWFLYEIAAGSFYIFLLVLILVNIYSFIALKRGDQKFASWFFIISILLLVYSSFLMLLISPLYIIGLLIVDFEQFKKFKRKFLLLLLFIIPLIFLILSNKEGIINIYHQQVNFLSDPGLINAVNLRRGEGQAVGLGTLVKLFENKYLYLSSYITLKFLSNLSIPNYFTMNAQLLGFSFAPPLFLGFLIPFFYGLSIIFRSMNQRKYLVLSILLFIPSLLSEKIVDLDRLVIVLPFFTLVISVGLIDMIKGKGKKYKALLVISLLLIFIQLISTIIDINLREFARFQRVNGQINLQLKQ